MKLRTTMKLALAAAAAGGAAIYFSDPDRGPKRRERVNERVRQLTERPSVDADDSEPQPQGQHGDGSTAPRQDDDAVSAAPHQGT